VKGPGLRIDLDVRRVWRCAKCGKTVRTQGQITAQRCGCADGSQWMELQPPVKREPFRAPHRDPIPEDGPDPETDEKTESVPELPVASAAPSPAAEPVEPAPTATIVVETALTETVVVEYGPAEQSSAETAPAPPTPSPAPDKPDAPPAPNPPATDEFGAGLTS
jgi:hypothetical protein